MVKTFSKLALSAAVAGLAFGASAQQLEEVGDRKEYCSVILDLSGYTE
jgi:hypothetical protein